MAYPPTTDEILSVVAKFPYLVARPTLQADTAMALKQARGVLVLSCPQAEEGSLDPKLDLAAWSVTLDLSVWYMRYAVERNPDSGAPPTSLIDARREIDDRVEKIGKAATKQDGLFTMAPFDPLDSVPFSTQL